jgi:hypothetical protein
MLPLWMKRLKVGDMAAYIGMYSYSIYLWHLMVPQHLQGLLRPLWPEIGETACFWAYGSVLSRLIEYPVLHVRDRFLPSRGTKQHAPVRSSLQLIVANAGFAADAGHAQAEIGEGHLMNVAHGGKLPRLRPLSCAERMSDSALPEKERAPRERGPSSAKRGTKTTLTYQLNFRANWNCRAS